ncbi:MAG: ABC transporter ATP-binding protein [Desulfovibrionaceae bacterium]|nr:ABC transporter ATP-binding protein [Desulfovibrionaceae bacterium]
MPDVLFSLKDLSLSYGKPPLERQILKKVHFRLKANEQIGLFAPNGSGKTSLLRLLTGLVLKKEGHIFFEGREVQSEKDFQLLRRQVGYVLQEAQDQIFFPTVFEDVLFGPINLDLPLKEAYARAYEALKALNILELKERHTLELSGGEKRLVALAGILAMHPKVLLLDEPTSGLDVQAQERLESILQKLSGARIVVSHDLLFLTKVATKFYTIQEQKILEMPAPVLHYHKHAHLGGNMEHEHF